MARRKYMNGLKRHPSHYRNKSPMLHDSKASHPHPHSDKLETTLIDSVYSKSKVDDSLVAMGYDPNTRETKQSDGTVVKGKGEGGWSQKKTTVRRIPDNFQQMGKETKDNTFSRSMLAPENYF